MGEPPDLWEKNLPARFRDRALRFPNIQPFESNHHLRAGCWDPHARLQDLALDGISAEVLYPTLGVQAWLVDDVELEEACIRVYNDWMIDFCKVAPERFWGHAMISLRNIDHAIAELERCRAEGLRGASIWIAPPEDLPYSSDHYERFWDAAQAMDVPLGMHINARAAPRRRPPDGVPTLRELHSVSEHKYDGMNALGHIIGSGVLERYPRLKVLVAEIGVGWIPFWLQEFDHYAGARSKLPSRPSEYFNRQVYSTFISDRVGGYMLNAYGKNNFMWSNDYPHPASIWPDSGVIIEEDLGHLDADVRASVVGGNVARVYNDGEPPPPADPIGDRTEVEEWLKSHSDFGASSRLHTASLLER
jgi:predicted TIM-barrel fold metal-dependent hydrolase